MRTLTSLLMLAALAALAVPSASLAQRGRGAGPGAAPQTPRAAAAVDLTGYWVSVVTEDWRYRMVTPAQGDYQGVPLTPAARKIADSWDPAKETASGDLRKNGVPYSENASVTEYYEVVTQPDGSPLLAVTISTTDPEYLRTPFVISSQFKKEATDAKWKPSPCSATW